MQPADSLHPAHAGLAAHSAETHGRFRARRRPAIRMRRERRILLADALLPARRTVHVPRFGGAADQPLKFRIAVLTLVFVNRHSYSVINTHILSRTPRTSPDAAFLLFERNEKASIAPLSHWP